MLKYFEYSHLPNNLQDISKPFCDLANSISYLQGDFDEVQMCLRKLLEAKDCAVRAAIN